MNEKIIQCFNNFQIADLDDDMVGMCKTLIEFMSEIRRQLNLMELPKSEPPENFYKLDPHQPKMEQRKNYRKFLAFAVKKQNDSDENVVLMNIFVTLQIGVYTYHMPMEKMLELSKLDSITRELAQETLLIDKMSPNWIKEPSGKDFSAIML